MGTGKVLRKDVAPSLDVTCKSDASSSGMDNLSEVYAAVCYRTLAVSVVIAIVLVALIVGLLYSGLVSDLLPRGVLFGS
jgi:hypothetical protein